MLVLLLAACPNDRGQRPQLKQLDPLTVDTIFGGIEGGWTTKTAASRKDIDARQFPLSPTFSIEVPGVDWAITYTWNVRAANAQGEAAGGTITTTCP